MPKPPPTSPTTTRIFSVGRPSTLAQRVARAGRHLAGQTQRQPVGRRVVARQRAARLHRRRRQALVDEVERDDMRRARRRRRRRPRRRRAASAPRCCRSRPARPAARPRRSPRPARSRRAVPRIRRRSPPARPSPVRPSRRPARRPPRRRSARRSSASAGRSGVAPGEPSGRWNIGASGSGLTPAATRSAPVRTARTPGIAVAAAASIETMRACACGERRNAR